MLNNLKALVVIVFLATAVFIVLKPVALRFMTEEDFRLRRGVWFTLLVAAFASPSFWLFAVIAIPVAAWAGSKDSNPAALAIMLGSALPVAIIEVPKLIPVGPGTIISFCVVIPAMVRAGRTRSAATGAAGMQTARLAAFLLFVYFTLQVIPYLQVESIANAIRRETRMMLGGMLAYLFFSKVVTSHRQITECVAAIVISSAIVALVAMFESARGWLLYTGVAGTWGSAGGRFSYLMRAGQLRALGPTDHSLALGFMLALAFGFTFYLRRWVSSNAIVVGGWVLFWGGLLAAYSRGPWFMAVLIMFSYLWLLPGGMGRTMKATVIIGVLAAILLSTPVGQRMAEALPFVGKVDSANVDYRQRLLERSLELIPQHPWFGDIAVREQMDDLRQGQGIVDLVNGFLNIALRFGLVPIGILLVFLVIVLGRTFRTSRALQYHDADGAALGSILMAAIVGSLFFTWVARFPGELWMLCGLSIAYARLAPLQAREPRPAPARRSASARLAANTVARATRQ